MERIASFTVDHTKLQPGMYLSRQDGAVVTYDLRFKRPNTGDLLSKDAVLYFGPMGCQTGFYLLVDGSRLDHAGAIALMQEVCRRGADYDGPMPGRSAAECGNYRNLDLALARKLCPEYGAIVQEWTVDKLRY